MSEIYKPVNGTIQIPAALTAGGSFKVSVSEDVKAPSKIASGTDGAGAAYTSTASYASCIAGPKLLSRPYSCITINVKEANVNAVMYQIVGYTEASGFTRGITLATALDVAKNGSDYQVVSMGLLAIDVQAIDKVGGTHGSVICDVVLS